MKHARPSGTPRRPRPVPDDAARTAAGATPSAPDGTQDTEAGTTTVTSTKGGLGRSSMLMASGTAVSRILGLVRNVLLITAIGTTGLAADAFDVANKIPNVLFAILAGGVLNAVLVPQIIRAFRSKNPQERLDKLLTLSGVLLLGLSLLLTSASTIIVSLYTDGWGSAQFSLAVAFAFWCIPQLFFYGLYTLLGQVLNARGQFGPFMWAPVVNNVVSIVGFVAFILVYGPYATGAVEDLGTWDGAKIALLAGTATLGVASQALILILPLWRSGFRWHFRLGLHGIGLRSAGQVAIWTFGAVILEQVGVLFTTQFASSAPAAALRQTFGDYASEPAALGMVTGVVTGAPEAFAVAGNAAYTQALMIYLLPHSLVTVSIATALFTGMSAAAGAGDFARVRHDLSRGVRTVGVFTVFATAVFAILALPLTKLLLINVSPSGAVAVSQILVAMAFGLVPLGGMVLMKWVYFAYEDGKTVFMIQVPATVALVGIAWLATRTLDPVWWVVGVGAAMSLSNMIVVLLRTAGLRRKLHGLDAFRIVRMHVKTILAAGASAAVGWGVLQLFGDLYGLSWLRAAVVTAVVGIVMTAVYIGGLKVMRVRELDQLADPLLRKLGRRRPAAR
ncbi:murein biosynthesis integral membrane protein MurJ [Oerskovia enterophila]|uniref:murein biosynthesis integral membrane protein MurJ n=1 Tax=Oerskovia enterophila TaxID=43678 RepID=UPI0033993C70